MYKLSRIVTVAIAGLAVSSTAFAGGAFTGRAGITAGGYNFDATATSTGCPTCFPAGTEFYSAEDGDSTFGLIVGANLNIARFFADLGIEASKYAQGYDQDGDGEGDDTYRTDGLFTLGAYIGDRWSAFAGYRNATFGDAVFSEHNGNTESGPFIGGGVSFRPGDRIALGASAAYNHLTLSYEGNTFEDIDINGVSVKLQMNILRTPHSVFLRWQRFKGKEDVPDFFYTYEYTEDYLNLGYQATFDFASW